MTLNRQAFFLLIILLSLLDKRSLQTITMKEPNTVILYHTCFGLVYMIF